MSQMALPMIAGGALRGVLFLESAERLAFSKDLEAALSTVAGQAAAALALSDVSARQPALQAVISVSGAPVTPEPAASNGFKIERNYVTLAGKPADITKAKQNERFAVVLKITEAKPEYGKIMVVDGNAATRRMVRNALKEVRRLQRRRRCVVAAVAERLRARRDCAGG